METNYKYKSKLKWWPKINRAQLHAIILIKKENRQRCGNDIFLLIPPFSTIHRTTRKMQRKDLVSLHREIKCLNHECPT